MKELCHKAIEVVKKTGEFISNEYYVFERHKMEYKSFNSIVSYVDKTAEQMIVEGLQKLLPEAGFIAEEGTGTPSLQGYNWIIDPLDGTTNFVHGIPVFSVSVALMKDSETLIGIVYEPLRNECFYAYKNGDAWLNDKPIAVTQVEDFKRALVATGFPYYDFEKMNQYVDLMKFFMKNCHGLRRMGSAAIDLVYVACGRFDVFFEYNLSPWDVAAGAFIIEEAGGKVSDFMGGNNYIFGKQILATNHNLHKLALGKCTEYFS